MSHFAGYQCSRCQETYSKQENLYLCPQDGGVLDIVLDWGAVSGSTRPENIKSSPDYSMWRYLPLLPVDAPSIKDTPLNHVGWTPIYETPRLADDLNLERLWVKDESPNPSASFKDRASALIIQRAAEIDAETIVTASTGNAGAAMAAMAAAVGASAVILAPKSAPPAKIAQLLVYGAQVFLVDGSYDQAVQLAQKAALKYGWYCRNTGYNPFTGEGKKTAAFEIWEQLLPKLEKGETLALFVSVGDGNIISGLHKGFRDLQALGWLESMPRLFGVQAKGSAALAEAYERNSEEIREVQADTLADSISVNLPSDGLRALRAARETEGAYLTVSDGEILDAVSKLGASGIFAEPAGAAALAGVRKARQTGLLGADDAVLALNTGSGLKDVGAAMQAVAEAQIIAPDLGALAAAVDGIQ